MSDQSSASRGYEDDGHVMDGSRLPTDPGIRSAAVRDDPVSSRIYVNDSTFKQKRIVNMNGRLQQTNPEASGVLKNNSPPLSNGRLSGEFNAKRSSGSLLNHRKKESQSLTKKLASREQELKQVFGLGDEVESEELLDTFMCALKKRILLQGRMYIFTKHVCFSCSLFGYHKLKRIPIASILSLRKMKNVGFPNSVEIVWKESETCVKTDFFTSFLSRDEAFKLILSLWEATHVKQRLAKLSGTASYAAGQSSMAPDIDEGSSESNDEYDESDSEGYSVESKAKHSAFDQMLHMHNDGVLPSLDHPESEGEIMTPREGYNEESKEKSFINSDNPFNWEEPELLEPPPAVPPVMQKVMEYDIPVHPQEFYDLFLSSKSEFFIDYHGAQGHKNIELSAWDSHGSMGPVRDLSFVTALKGLRIGPPEALCHQTQRIGVYAGSHIVFETSQVMSDIPYGDHFKVETRWDIFPNSNENGSNSTLVIHIAVPFTKSTMWKRFIEKGVTDSLLEAYQMFRRLAAQKLAENETSEGESNAKKMPHAPEDLLPQQEADWEMILDRVEPQFREGLASLRKMQQEVARRDKFSLTKSKHRRNMSVIDSDVLDALLSDSEGDSKSALEGGKGSTGVDLGAVCDHASNQNKLKAWSSLKGRERVYLSVIALLLMLVACQAFFLYRTGLFSMNHHCSH
jgi:hypothetical protein